TPGRRAPGFGLSSVSTTADQTRDGHPGTPAPAHVRPSRGGARHLGCQSAGGGGADTHAAAGAPERPPRAAGPPPPRPAHADRRRPPRGGVAARGGRRQRDDRPGPAAPRPVGRPEERPPGPSRPPAGDAGPACVPQPRDGLGLLPAVSPGRTTRDTRPTERPAPRDRTGRATRNGHPEGSVRSNGHPRTAPAASGRASPEARSIRAARP